ncbi:MAG TPA: FG-GAP-like repeat-containing protein, partial [Pyrinomonadaceae bacterium]|nr:FG-GAP-like repeat-containing protein [Pyrinomonadaceae bacterium]
MFHPLTRNQRSLVLMVLLTAVLVAAGLGFRVTQADSGYPAQRYALRFGPRLTANSPASGTLAFSSQATLQAWICLEAASPNGHVFSNNTSYGFRVDGSGRIAFFDGGTVAAAPAALTFRSWTHVAATFNAGAIRLYVNGQQVASASAGASLPANNQLIFSGTTPENGGYSSGGFSGALAQVSLWNRALNQSEIQTFASQYLLGNETGLAAYYPFDQIEIFRARDAGPSNLALQLGTRQYGSDDAEPKFADFDSVTNGPYFQNEIVANPGFALRGNEGRLLDVNSDGKPDLIANRFDSDSLLPMFAMSNNGTGGFTNATTSILGNSPPQTEHERDYAVADFNGDGRPDLFLADHGPESGPLAFAGGFSRLLINHGDGTVVDETAARMPVRRMFTHHADAADIDGDGDIDIFLCNLGNAVDNKNPEFLINDGTGHFTENSSRLPQGLLTNGVYATGRFGDFDNDGDQDIILGAAGYAGLSRDALLINDGHGNFSFAPASAIPLHPSGMNGTNDSAIADFDGDGKLDAVMANSHDDFDSRVQLLLNNGDNTFRDASSRIEQLWPVSASAGGGRFWIIWIKVVDFNKDGKPDFMTTTGTFL